MEKKIIAICLLASILFLKSAYSEPTPNVRFLMNTPVSLFDFGIYQLSIDLRDIYLPNKIKLLTTVDYKSDINRIVISTGLPFNIPFTEEKLIRQNFDLVQRADSIDEAKKLCRSAINSIRQMLGINIDTGNPLLTDISSLFHRFSPMASTIYVPKNLYVELDGITKIEGHFFVKNHASVKCEGPLVSKEILFLE